MDAKKRLEGLGIVLPPAAKPVGSYVPGVLVDKILFMSGHGPFDSTGQITSIGKLGRDMSTSDAQKVARQVALNMLGSIDSLVGLDRVKRVVKVLGFVNCVDGYVESPQVINGFSDCMVEVFGESRGAHARSAVGVSELPGGIPVEVEAIFELS